MHPSRRREFALSCKLRLNLVNLLDPKDNVLVHGYEHPAGCPAVRGAPQYCYRRLPELVGLQRMVSCAPGIAGMLGFC
jgi:hypothetical protein